MEDRFASLVTQSEKSVTKESLWPNVDNGHYLMRNRLQKTKKSKIQLDFIGEVFVATLSKQVSVKEVNNI